MNGWPELDRSPDRWSSLSRPSPDALTAHATRSTSQARPRCGPPWPRSRQSTERSALVNNAAYGTIEETDLDAVRA
jgi:hypothetical protein